MSSPIGQYSLTPVPWGIITALIVLIFIVMILYFGNPSSKSCNDGFATQFVSRSGERSDNVARVFIQRDPRDEPYKSISVIDNTRLNNTNLSVDPSTLVIPDINNTYIDQQTIELYNMDHKSGEDPDGNTKKEVVFVNGHLHVFDTLMEGMKANNGQKQHSNKPASYVATKYTTTDGYH